MFLNTIVVPEESFQPLNVYPALSRLPWSFTVTAAFIA